MCGIVGLLRRDRAVGEDEITAMVRAIRHRGPDGEGTWINQNIALGHARLSIIDLESGKQPMSDAEGSVWITYNGELYNYLELKATLKNKGYSFITNSDTEVIIYAYKEWKEKCVEHFRGMFAFCIADNRNKILFLARDHFGIKPLVYYSSVKAFAFASEIQALKKISDVKFALDLSSLKDYMCFNYTPAPKTIFEEIKKLPPAHRMTVKYSGEVIGIEKYWDFNFSPDSSRTEADYLEELDHVIQESVRVHLVSDVPFGAFLSGGLDSSSVLAYMSKISNKPVKAFTIGFESEEFNELEYAKTAAKINGCEFHYEMVKPDAIGILPELVKGYGEPFGDSSAIPTYYVCKMARKYVPMVLSGDGADELFAGYKAYFFWLKYLTHGHLPASKRWIYTLMNGLFPNTQNNRANSAFWKSMKYRFPMYTESEMWNPDIKFKKENGDELFDPLFAHAKKYSLVNKVQYTDIHTYLPFDILSKVDIASMIHGLEVRTPFIDLKVLEFASRIPEKFNLAKSGDSWTGKMLLKKLMEKYYPKEFIYRPKKGFAVPLRHWFNEDANTKSYINDKLFSSKAHVNNYFKPEFIKKVVSKNTANDIWSLLFLEEWMSQNN